SLEQRTQALVVASRQHFDGLLVQAAETAGADLVRARVTDLTRDGGSSTRVVLQQGAPLSTRFVIGADGANSLVRRRMGTPFRRDQLSMATGFFAHGVT